VSVGERVWRTDEKKYLRLLPEGIGVSTRGRSVRLERALTDFGCEHSFGHAAGRVLEHYGFEISPSAVREATLTHAQRARQQLEEQYQESFHLLPSVGAEHVIAEADGTMICTVAPGKRDGKRPREWKEMRLSAAQAQGKKETFYAATFGEVDEVGRRWGHCARRAGRGLNSQIHALGDGAEWIRLQTREVFGAQGTFLRDFFHVSEYLGAAAESCRADAPDRWRRTQQDRLKRGALGNERVSPNNLQFFVYGALADYKLSGLTRFETATLGTGSLYCSPIAPQSFRPASRRTAQASRLCYPWSFLTGFYTLSPSRL
jgi:hypothetical protein